ncbi:hypothetical protein HK102_005141, partial [Quaeritorhiza haematococci]
SGDGEDWAATDEEVNIDEVAADGDVVGEVGTLDASSVAPAAELASPVEVPSYDSYYSEALGWRYQCPEPTPRDADAEVQSLLEEITNVLREVGELADRYGHRLTMHPGQYTQLASPHPHVLLNSLLDLHAHASLLDAMSRPPDSVIVIHMGGVFGDKQETMRMFERNWRKYVPEGVKRRVVLENDDRGYCVEDLLPLCKRLSIPLVLDWHHETCNPSPHPLSHYLPRITHIFNSRHITPKQHISSPRNPHPDAPQQDKRAHAEFIAEGEVPAGIEDGVDVMVEAKGKEMAVLRVWREYMCGGGVGGEAKERQAVAKHEAGCLAYGGTVEVCVEGCLEGCGEECNEESKKGEGGLKRGRKGRRKRKQGSEEFEGEVDGAINDEEGQGRVGKRKAKTQRKAGKKLGVERGEKGEEEDGLEYVEGLKKARKRKVKVKVKGKRGIRDTDDGEGDMPDENENAETEKSRADGKRKGKGKRQKKGKQKGGEEKPQTDMREADGNGTEHVREDYEETNKTMTATTPVQVQAATLIAINAAATTTRRSGRKRKDVSYREEDEEESDVVVQWEQAREVAVLGVSQLQENGVGTPSSTASTKSRLDVGKKARSRARTPKDRG